MLQFGGFSCCVGGQEGFSGMMSSLNKYPGFNPQSLRPALNIPNRLSGNYPLVVMIRSTSCIIHLGNIFVTLVIFAYTVGQPFSLTP